MVMDRLGPSLEDLFQKCKRCFSLKTVCIIGLQILDRIEYIHSKDIIHRDIKPDNFLIGRGRNSHIIYIVDFGLAKKVRNHQGFHIPYKENKVFTGTARYASLNTHLGIEQDKRDDLEGMIYILLYFLLGQLPWQGICTLSKKEKYDKIMEYKMIFPIKELCKGKPIQFVQIFNYVRSLEFEEEPDYQYIRGLIKGIMEDYNLINDYDYDWNIFFNVKDETKSCS